MQVVDTWADEGQRGHLVYKYHLKRMEGQPKLTTNQVYIWPVVQVGVFFYIFLRNESHLIVLRLVLLGSFSRIQAY